ncbi:MAG: hypothetical protein JSW66_05305 [Phycisphaerales bacterium]|nr:MAG: hypothetical protein JSW66_05305 [Phycisphaerales bacterium]
MTCFCLVGCAEPENAVPVWEQVKIGDLAPYEGERTPRPQTLKTVNLDVYIFETPAANLDKLDKIRKTFYIRPLRLKSYPSFDADGFLVRFGQGERWSQIRDIVLAAGGQRVANVSLALPDALSETIAVAGLDRPQSIFFTAPDGSKQAANIGPGVLGLRVKAETIPGARGRCSVSAYPVFSPPTQRAVPLLTLRAKMREFPFTTAAFGLNMRPGDFVYLGPKEYLSDQTTLGGLFFSNPQGRLFFSQTEAAEFKPAVRVFLLFCTGVNY